MRVTCTEYKQNSNKIPNSKFSKFKNENRGTTSLSSHREILFLINTINLCLGKKRS